MESNGVDEVMIVTGDLKRSRAMTDDGEEKFNDGIMSATDKICCMFNLINVIIFHKCTFKKMRQEHV